jgi:hypothetical protein
MKTFEWHMNRRIIKIINFTQKIFVSINSIIKPIKSIKIKYENPNTKKRIKSVKSIRIIKTKREGN